MKPPIALTIRNVSKRFPDAKGGPGTLALEDVSLDVRQGEFLSVIGPSGCGKSTLFNIIGGNADGIRWRGARRRRFGARQPS